MLTTNESVSRRWSLSCAVVALTLLPVGTTWGQAVTLTNPAISARNSFFQNTGVSFGFGVGGSSARANLGFGLQQGSRRTLGSTGVVGTGFSGAPIVVRGGLQRPFVTGVIPNVGFGQGAVPATIPSAPPQRPRVIRGGTVVQNGRLIRLPTSDRTQESAAPQVDPRKRAKAIAYFRQGEAAVLQGRVSIARRYFQRAANVGDADVQMAAYRRMAALPAR